MHTWLRPAVERLCAARSSRLLTEEKSQLPPESIEKTLIQAVRGREPLMPQHPCPGCYRDLCLTFKVALHVQRAASGPTDCCMRPRIDQRNTTLHHGTYPLARAIIDVTVFLDSASTGRSERRVLDAAMTEDDADNAVQANVSCQRDVDASRARLAQWIIRGQHRHA